MHPRIAPLWLAVAAVLCACSAKDAAKPDSTKTTTQAGAPAAGTSLGSYDAATHVATIHAKDYAFEAPDSIQSGWTTFHLVNDGPGIHHAQLFRLDSGKTVADLAAVFKSPGPPPAWAVPVGGTNAPDPSASSNSVFNLQPGNYAVICLVDIPDKVPHVAKGMIHALTVTQASGTPAAEPTSDASVTLSDYAFTMKAPLTAGKHILKITNTGPQVHELELIRLEPGKTVKDAAAFLYDTSAKGPPPLHALGGVGGMAPGTTSYAEYDLTPGHYAMMCFVPAPDGKQHFEHGMIKEFTIQ